MNFYQWQKFVLLLWEECKIFRFVINYIKNSTNNCLYWLFYYLGEVVDWLKIFECQIINMINYHPNNFTELEGLTQREKEESFNITTWSLMPTDIFCKCKFNDMREKKVCQKSSDDTLKRNVNFRNEFRNFNLQNIPKLLINTSTNVGECEDASEHF